MIENTSPSQGSYFHSFFIDIFLSASFCMIWGDVRRGDRGEGEGGGGRRDTGGGDRGRRVGGEGTALKADWTMRARR